MNNIEKTKSFESKITKTPFGTITELHAAIEISAHQSIDFGNKSLLANYVYEVNGTYKLIYSIVDTDGKTESFAENDGILPTLFLSPDSELYVSVVPYDPDKELEISIPVFNRDKTELPKGNRPFKGNFIGVLGQYSLFYDVDIWSKTKPDKLLAIEFKNGAIKKKHNSKVALPPNNKVFLSDNKIHLLTKDQGTWLHRQIDEKGSELRKRIISGDVNFLTQILNLSFKNVGHLLTQHNGKLVINKVDTHGQSQTIELIDFADPFFNTWSPIHISGDTTVTRFNGEFGNGWITIRGEKLLEFFYSKGVQGYRNLVTNEVLKIEHNNLIISSVNKTTSNAYAVVLYPKAEHPAKNNKLIILNREVK